MNELMQQGQELFSGQCKELRENVDEAERIFLDDKPTFDPGELKQIFDALVRVSELSAAMAIVIRQAQEDTQGYETRDEALEELKRRNEKQ